MTSSRGLLAVALVVSSTRSERTVAALEWSLAAGPSTMPALRTEAARALDTNAMADALPFFEALARDDAESLKLPLSATLSLQLQLQPALQLERLG